MKINRSAKKFDLNQISKAIVSGIQNAAESAQAEVAKIQGDDRYTDAYKRQLIQDVAVQYETTVQGIRNHAISTPQRLTTFCRRFTKARSISSRDRLTISA